MTDAHLQVKPDQRIWSLADHAIVRVGGLATSSIGSLGSDQSHLLIQEYRQLNKLYDESKGLVSDHLGRLVKKVGDHDDVRKPLLNVRKALFHGKIPKDEWLKKIHEHLELEDWKTITAAINSLNRRNDIEDTHGQVLEADIASKHCTMQDILRDNKDFLSAMDNVNPNLSERIGSLLNSPFNAAQKWQKTLPEITSRMMRSAVKTSPLSRLTFTVPLNLCEADPALSQGPNFRIEIDEDEFQSEVDVNRGLLMRLGHGLARNRQIRPFLQFRLNNSLSIAEGSFQFVVREQAGNLSDKFVQSSAAPALLWILSKLNSRGAFYIADIPEIIGIDPSDELSRIVEELIEKGLLIPCHLRGDNDLNPIESFIKYLDPSSEITAALQDHLRGIKGLLKSYAEAGTIQRKELRMSILTAINTVETMVGIKETVDSRRLLYENSSAQKLRWGSPNLPALHAQNLANLASLAYILSESWADSTAGVERFVREFGVGGICQNPYQYLLQAEGNTEQTLAQKEYLCKISQQQELRYKLKSELLQDIADRVILQGDSTVFLRMEDFSTSISNDIWSFPDSYAVLMQACEQDQKFAINMFGLGFGTLFARQFAVFERSPSGRKVIASIQKELQHQFNIKGYHQISVNSQQTVNTVPLLAPGAIVSAYNFPDADAQRSDHELRHLQLIHDPKADQLYFLSPQGEIVRPLNLGSLVKYYLPPLEKGLAELCPEFSYDSIRLVQALDAMNPQFKPIRLVPRIMVGDVCLTRRSWVVHELEPFWKMKEDTDLSYKSRILDVLEQNGIPLEVFLYPPNLWVHPSRLGEQEKEPRSKPEFIDFTNQLLFKHFEAWSKTVAAPWVFQEVLPHWSDTVTRSGERDLVTEFCFEIYNRGKSDV